MRKFFGVALVIFFVFAVLDLSFAAAKPSAAGDYVIGGRISKISDDGKSFAIAGKERRFTVFTTKNFIIKNKLKVGNRVKISVTKTEKGLKANAVQKNVRPKKKRKKKAK